MRKHIFNAGPAVLPTSVLEATSKAVLDLNGIGQSVLEISHRGKDFDPIMEQAQAKVKELYGLGEEYSVLYLQGGASTQFCMVPYNLLDAGETAGYLDTGSWANKAIKEAKLFGDVSVLGSSKEANYTYIPKGYDIPDHLKYIHLTSNNTIYGTQIHHFPETSVSKVVDMSSDIFSRPQDLSQFDLIYAGAQKNLGPAGTTLVILKSEILNKVSRSIPSMLDYRIHIDNGSAYNTPPVMSIYVCYLTLNWLLENGGLAAMGAVNERKARKLYAEIDRNPLFKGTAAVEDRSEMNVTFLLEDDSLQDRFMKLAADANIVGIKGHRSVGGFRASIYNALPEESVDVLIEVMQAFEKGA